MAIAANSDPFKLAKDPYDDRIVRPTRRKNPKIHVVKATIIIVTIRQKHNLQRFH